MSNINIEKIIHLTKTEGWKEFKKLIQEKKQELALDLIYKTGEDFEKRKITVLAYDSIIALAENFDKREKIRKGNNERLDSLSDIPNGLE